MRTSETAPRNANGDARAEGLDVARRILELARWAPSGDNTQPWRFEIVSPTQMIVHGHDTRADCVYDLDGIASQLAHGMLIETIAIAATAFGRQLAVVEVAERGSDRVEYVLRLAEHARCPGDPLAEVITSRTVQRRAMLPRRLSDENKLQLERSAAPFSIRWLESWPQRVGAASLNARNAYIRMTIPEAFAVHQKIIAFDSDTSEDRVPGAALGAPAPLLAVMRWAFGSWQRMERVNRYLGTWMPRLLLDFIPSLLCGAHVAFAATAPLAHLSDRLAAGRAIQRFWLTATRLDLQMQPSYTPLLFARYAKEGRMFSRTPHAIPAAQAVRKELLRVLGPDADNVFWFCRIGAARAVRGRSLRLPLDELILPHGERRDQSSAASVGSV